MESSLPGAFATTSVKGSNSMTVGANDIAAAVVARNRLKPSNVLSHSPSLARVLLQVDALIPLVVPSLRGALFLWIARHEENLVATTDRKEPLKPFHPKFLDLIIIRSHPVRRILYLATNSLARPSRSKLLSRPMISIESKIGNPTREPMIAT